MRYDFPYTTLYEFTKFEFNVLSNSILTRRPCWRGLPRSNSPAYTSPARSNSSNLILTRPSAQIPAAICGGGCFALEMTGKFEFGVDFEAGLTRILKRILKSVILKKALSLNDNDSTPERMFAECRREKGVPSPPVS